MIEFDVGARVRQLRQERDLTVRELARRSGVSATQISEIERNLTAPTVPTLMKIISSLGTDMSIFFVRNKLKRVSLVRKGDRQEFIDRRNNVYIQSLSNGITDSKLKVILAYPPPGAENIRGGYQHAGEELLYVIKGRVQVTVDDTAYTLEEGDSIHFHAELRHTIKNITAQEVELIAVITPPSY